MQSGRTSLALLHASRLMHGLTMQVFMGDQPLLRFEWDLILSPLTIHLEDVCKVGARACSFACLKANAGLTMQVF